MDIGIRSPTETKKPAMNQELRSTQKDNHHGPLLPKKPITGSAIKTKKEATKQTALAVKSGRRSESDHLSSPKSHHSVVIAQDSSPK